MRIKRYVCEVYKYMNNGIFLLLGTNLGEKVINLQRALSELKNSDAKILKASSIYQTSAWGKTDQPLFYNQVIEIDTTLNPGDLLDLILSIETKMGRKRGEKWGSRIIDIDILFYQDRIVDQKNLIIPHPGIAERRFTLIPLNEIATDLLHPVLQKKIKTLLQECLDPLLVEPIEL